MSVLTKIEISNWRKILVKNDPINTPKLQKAWKPDIIDLPSRDSILDALRLIHISKSPKQKPNINARIINVTKSFIKGTGTHNSHWAITI